MSYLLIGLGNPGKKFELARHNAGKMFTAYLSNYPIAGLEVFETDCFMNVSGNFVRKIVRNTRKTRRAGKSEIQKVRDPDIRAFRFSDSPRISGFKSIQSFPNLVIAHDDLDLRLGSYKIQFGKGPRQHKGILSIEQALGTKEFWRVRIGIENRGKMTNDELRMTNNIQHSTFNIQHYPSGEDYVLERFTAAEKKILEAVFPVIRDRMKQLII